MRTRLLPLGLAVLFFNPSFAQTVDIGRGDAYETNNIRAPRANEPVAPLTLKAALELALGANPGLSAAGRELEAVEATITQAQVRPNPQISTLIEDTRRATRTTTLQLNQPIELGGKRAARIVPPMGAMPSA
jgi:cobalt-zinc-cadmium efflux system outer membrane protein